MSTEINYRSCKPEIWGGIECTINRVGDIYKDQLQYSGYYERQEDIEHFSRLGIKALRYPILWERHEPSENKKIDWTWTEKQLNELKKNNITLIAGLVHHGSGPNYTNLCDPLFPEKLAKYAKQVAKKFPWIEYYTPVNEPLTTARFSGLYGIWYPHKKDACSFFQILLYQVKATVLSMKAIRSVNPKAKLVQTEDLAKIHSTVLLKYQADFENKRRWLTYDLLCGKVDNKHSLWKNFINAGIAEEELNFFVVNKCHPDIIGCNYYVTSERYLDENYANYPASTHGGNDRHSYSDTEAVRVIKPAGLKTLLKETWNRYHLPVAVTEIHLACTREQQLRWFKEIWDTCCELRNEGINIQAVTAWALLGSYDWNSLLTCNNNYYESGVFDIRNNFLRKTALTKLISSLSDKGDYEHPLLSSKGWWHKNISSKNNNANTLRRIPNPILIIGKTGTLGNAFAKICARRSIPYILMSRQEMNICDETSITKAIAAYKPWAIINTAGFVRVDDAEMAVDECISLNANGPALLAKNCSRSGIKFMTFSSDLVFDGNKNTPYFEADKVNPLNVYGMSKARGEAMVLAQNESSLIIRSSAFFGPWDRWNFAYLILNNLKNNQPSLVVNDVIVSPTYIPDLVDTALDLFIDDESGIWHLSNDGSFTWEIFASHIAERGGYSSKLLVPKTLMQMRWKAKRPLYSVLESSNGIRLPSVENAMDRFFEEMI